ncbi:MAG: diacylglycerol kinase family protein [Clostridiales bacterium]|nr:diacylglycerol kinase family protein [Clostridiales bacterium]MCF8021441.1 diacylglycerol kinase family protein [Clostridiales bacterium]
MTKRNVGFIYAVKGILHALKTQSNLRIQFIIAVIIILAANMFGVTVPELLWILLAVFLVLITELVNTAVENLADIVSPRYHPLVKAAKDTAAGAVLLAAIFSLVVAFFVFRSYIPNLF